MAIRNTKKCLFKGNHLVPSEIIDVVIVVRIQRIATVSFRSFKHDSV